MKFNIHKSIKKLSMKNFSIFLLLVGAIFLAMPSTALAAGSCGDMGYSINKDHYTVSSGSPSHTIILRAGSIPEGRYQVKITGVGNSGLNPSYSSDWVDVVTGDDGTPTLTLTISDSRALVATELKSWQVSLIKDAYGILPFDEEICYVGQYFVVPEGETPPSVPTILPTPAYDALRPSSEDCGSLVGPDCQDSSGGTITPAFSCALTPLKCCRTPELCAAPEPVPSPTPSTPTYTCGAISGGKCIINDIPYTWGNFQLCPNNSVTCCFQTSQCPESSGTGCGLWQGINCVKPDGTRVASPVACTRNTNQCCSETSLCSSDGLPGTDPGSPGDSGGSPGTAPVDIISGPKQADFDSLNPLKMNDNPYAEQLSSPGGVVSRLIVFAFPLAGLLLFVMLVWGGFEMLAMSATQKSMDAGRQRVTAALVGFFLLFISFWIMRIIEVIFGVAVI